MKQNLKEQYKESRRDIKLLEVELYLKIHIYSTRNFFIFLNHYDLIFFKYINVGWAALEGAKIALRESRRNSFLRNSEETVRNTGNNMISNTVTAERVTDQFTLEFLVERFTLRQLVSEPGFPFVLTMSGGNGDIQNVIQDIEALRDRMDAQEAAIRTLKVNLDQQFWRLDQRFEEMINRFDALGVDANRNRNDGGQRLRDQLAQGGVANVPVAANRRGGGSNFG
ncbi:hypothetical protein M9H77_22183 [Catharanthus roseus]|uniref:Uncharacterized protein n=1 Tax=Catharanthus roseus TaxID=4058 RepID=A0ACC0APR6_CATRO|nr:hypothetical protein M9H77_22183 [Catharanthus roseus]